VTIKTFSDSGILYGGNVCSHYVFTGIQIQALNEELVGIDRQMSETVSICDTMLPELTDSDQGRARALVNDHLVSIDR